MRSLVLVQLSSGICRKRLGTGVVRAAAVPSRCSCISSKRRTNIVTAATKGQILRGHGKNVWADAGWDVDQHTLTPELQRLVLAYGEMSQATYDNLGMDRSKDTFGYSVEAPSELLSYLTDQYPLAPDVPEPPGGYAPGTASRYKLPPVCDDGLSPIIHARPGKTSGKVPPAERDKLPVLHAVADKLFDTVTGALVTFVDNSNGGRRLFGPDPDTGKGIKERGAFIGYVAVSEPEGADKEVDVAVVWRGTIFKEEWESNFSQDKLTKWVPDPGAKADLLESSGSAEPPPQATAGKKQPSKGSDHMRAAADAGDTYIVPKPSEVGVHDGFDDLYNRRIDQPGGKLSPREVLRQWLPRLFRRYKVTTITSTGHSLGGGLATICAFGAADLLEKMWDSEKWKALRASEDWKTKDKPMVSLVSFAAPRVGNFTFGQEFRRMGVRAMRVVNKGDVVPNVPGLVVQGLSSVVEAVPVFGKSAATDMDSKLVQATSWLYYQVSRLTSMVYPDYWGYFHIGQVLEVDVATQAEGTVKAADVGSKHNLELYLHLVSKVGKAQTERNPLLMNKSADILTREDAPADWWFAAPPAARLLHRGCRLVHGRWRFP